ncbi:hypothetical protein [Nonomuraea basaltis]|uniref:hypothetical protein n=1 Tax=Nonomuraea basaltis TaxID=2495887 RepID=UPI00110C66F2|nr:hypothetical protein [Nonomuraea basaltis]TMR90900.1 hypothetical protein EJK15_52790 [Nonomuraea basaltis]
MKGVHEQVAELGDEARVVLVEPDAEQFRAVIGRRSVSSLLDPARRAPAARAGRRHGLEVASQVAAVWNDGPYVAGSAGGAELVEQQRQAGLAA